jgi:hypothetical protein
MVMPMPHAVRPSPSNSSAMPAPLPRPSQLAALGTVLCLYRAQSGGELSGWAQAVRAERGGGVDSDGLREHLLFHDRDGRPCWRLYLLPDSDFLAWERVAASLPVHAGAVREDGIGERLWSRLANRLRGDRWEASVLRLHALHCSPGFGSGAESPVLAASLVAPSSLGAAAARRIARAEGADGDALVEDCCCRQAASLAAQALSNAGSADDIYPLIRLNPRGFP